MTDLTLHKISSICTVGLVEEMKQKFHVSGVGDKAIFEERTIGWQMCLSDPPLTLLVQEKPPFVPGDKVKLSLEKLL